MVCYLVLSYAYAEHPLKGCKKGEGKPKQEQVMDTGASWHEPSGIALGPLRSKVNEQGCESNDVNGHEIWRGQVMHNPVYEPQMQVTSVCRF